MNNAEEKFIAMMEEAGVKFVDVTPDFDILYAEEELSNLT